MRLRLFLGFLLIFLAFWKGNGGYLDLREYLDDAERMWIKGDLRLPAEPNAPAQYNRYSLGLPFISGPFVLIGAAVERLTSGTSSRRAVAGLSVPIMAALAGALLFEISVLLNASKRIAFFAALIYCLGSPHLTFARFFYADMGVEFGVLVAVWSYLKSCGSPFERKWPLLAGVGLAIAGTCHYPHAPLVGAVGFCMLLGIIRETSVPLRDRVLNVALCSAVPVLAASVLICVNIARYGSLVPTGYQHEVHANISLRYILGNAHYLFNLALRTPWFFPVIGYKAFTFFKRPNRACASAGSETIAAAILLGTTAQLLFWLSYYQLNMFPIRYLQPMSALAAIALPSVLKVLDERFPQRGVAYAALILLVSNAAQFFGDTFFQPMLAAPPGKGDGVWFYTWYMNFIPAGASFDGGSPGGALQFVMLAALLGAGSWLLISAFSIARKDASG